MSLRSVLLVSWLAISLSAIAQTRQDDPAPPPTAPATNGI